MRWPSLSFLRTGTASPPGGISPTCISMDAGDALQCWPAFRKLFDMLGSNVISFLKLLLRELNLEKNRSHYELTLVDQMLKCLRFTMCTAHAQKRGLQFVILMPCINVFNHKIFTLWSYAVRLPKRCSSLGDGRLCYKKWCRLLLNKREYFYPIRYRNISFYTMIC